MSDDLSGLVGTAVGLAVVGSVLRGSRRRTTTRTTKRKKGRTTTTTRTSYGGGLFDW